ncbi:hypothetical protein LJC31_02640 [Synergistaceae bacterium OttesenSCG-928-I11]|nr:hypothetical protein [Synergistaceae bacterium OttesenSCG-928-I11]
MELTEASYIIVKGFIDAKDDRGKTAYGTLLALASRRDIKFISVWFANEEIPKDTEWDELLRLHMEKDKDPNRDPSAIRNEESLYDFLYKNTVLSGIVKNHNAKSAEQAISRFCLDHLQLKAVSFLDFLDATDGDIDYIESLETNEQEPQSEEKPLSMQSEESGGTIRQDGGKPSNEIFVKCEPALDPVNGIAMNEIRVGDTVYAKLPEDSVFFKLLAKNYDAFDGMINAEVTGILINDLGTATISLKLSDDVSGIMKLSGKVRIKVAGQHGAAETAARKVKRFNFNNLSTEAVVGLSGIVLLISALLAVYYIFW